MKQKQLGAVFRLCRCPAALLCVKRLQQLCCCVASPAGNIDHTISVLYNISASHLLTNLPHTWPQVTTDKADAGPRMRSEESYEHLAVFSFSSGYFNLIIIEIADNRTLYYIIYRDP